MSHRDEVLKILDGNDVFDAAETIYKGPKKIAIYCITLGLEILKSRKRRERRRELRSEIKPQFKAGPVTGSVVFTKKTKERLVKHTKDLFGDDGWMIGDINLGAMTKEMLLAQANSERASAKGSIRNAEFYEALAEPLRPDQMARDYWEPETAHKIRRKIWGETKEQRATLV